MDRFGEALDGVFDAASSIPHMIHQTYPTLDLPIDLRENADHLKAANPTWTYNIYDDAAIIKFITTHYTPPILNYYLRINAKYGAARADLFRYLVIYKLGGVYLDIKSRFLTPIDKVLRGDEHFVIARWSNQPGQPYEGFGLHPDLQSYPGGELQHWHVIAAPHHPFLRAVLLAIFDGIDTYRPWTDGTGKMGVLRLTGPIRYTRTITPLLTQFPATVFDTEQDLALQYSIVKGEAHKRLFKTHYTQIEDSIVQLHGMLWAADRLYQLTRTIKWQIQRLRGLADRSVPT